MMINHIITSSIVIIFVLILSVVFEKRISPCIKYALWLMVVLKLLLPIPDFESKYHILNFLEKPVVKEKLLEWSKNEGWSLNVIEDVEINQESIDGNLISDKIQQIIYIERLTEGKNGFDEIQEADSDEKNNLSSDKLENNRWLESFVEIDTQIIGNQYTGDQYEKASYVFLIIYILGVLTCGGIFLFGNIRFSKYLRQNGKYLKAYKNRIPTYKIEQYYGACLYGGFKPVIIVGNNKELSIEQQHMIMTHEYVHYLHGDHIWSLIRCICVVLYWYHPLVWVAASVSRRDSELACDEGTLKRLGKKQRIAYGQSLLEIAKHSVGFKDITRSVCFYSTTATGGIGEMKKRITMIVNGTKTSVIALLVILILLVGCIGCTLGSPVENSNTKNESNLKTEESLQGNKDERETEEENTSLKEEIVADAMVEKYNLYKEPQEDKVCIRVQPSEIREQLDYYYIPTDMVQEELKEMLNNMEILSDENKAEVITQIQSGEIDTYWNWNILYNEKYYKVYGEGYFSSLETGGENIGPDVFYEKNVELYERISNLLIQDLDYGFVDISTIRDITSATLQVKAGRTGYKLYTQTITDNESLKKLEQWFSNAREIIGLYDCESDGAALLLETADGDKIHMSLAADGCTLFAINGVFYDFQPNEKLVEGWHKNHVYELFDQIPNAFEQEETEILLEEATEENIQSISKENAELVDEETVTEVVLAIDNETNEINGDKNNFIWPTVSTTVSTNFGVREHPLTGEKKIIDYLGIAGNEGDSVYAVAEGIIADVGFDSTLGNYIILTTNSEEVVTYGHLSGSKVPKGQEVKAGEIIGLMGKTGSATGVFLSISVEVNGEMVDPMNYME